MKKKIFYDGIYSGHHSSYAKNIVMSTSNSKLLVNKNMIHKYEDIPKEKIDLLDCVDPQSFKLTPIGWIVNMIKIYMKKKANYKNDCMYFLYGDSIVFYLLFYLLLTRQRIFVTIHWANAVVPIEKYRSKLHAGLRRLKFKCFTIVCKSANVIVHGDFTKGKLTQKYGEINIYSIPYGIEKDNAREQALHLKRINENGRPKILFFGGIRRDKGIEKLAELASISPEYDFIVAGKPNDYNKETIRNMFRGLNNVKLYLGFIKDEEVKELFLNVNVLILPYEYYFSGQSGPLTIATIYSVPVVGTDVGDMGDDIKKHNLGEIVETNHPHLLKQAIEIVLKNGESFYRNNHNKFYYDSLWDKVGRLIDSIVK